MKETRIYHITHISNLSSIVAGCGLLCHSDMKRLSVECQEIAYQSLKNRRANKIVPVSPAGTLADYVPFYFANRSPMLAAIYMKRVEGYSDGQEKVLHLVSSVEAVCDHCRWCFTDGHAVEAPTRFFDSLQYLDEIDWNLIDDWKWWNTLDDPDRKRRKQAEFLIHRFLPWELVESIGVHDEEMAEAVKEIVGGSMHRPLISVEPKWYYSSKGRI